MPTQRPLVQAGLLPPFVQSTIASSLFFVGARRYNKILPRRNTICAPKLRLRLGQKKRVYHRNPDHPVYKSLLNFLNWGASPPFSLPPAGFATSMLAIPNARALAPDRPAQQCACFPLAPRPRPVPSSASFPAPAAPLACPPASPPKPSSPVFRN
jgi:hypothetical protein